MSRRSWQGRSDLLQNRGKGESTTDRRKTWSDWLEEKTDWYQLRPIQRDWVWASLFLLVLFTVLYLTLGTQKGFVWRGEFFRQSREGDTLTYRGTWAGSLTEIMRSPEGMLTLQIDGTQYGPYQVRLDPEAAKIKGDWEGPVDGGVVVSQGERELYRGAYYVTERQTGSVRLCAEGEPGNASYVGEFGNNHRKTSLLTKDLVRFALGEGLICRGTWYLYAAGTFSAVVNILSLLYANRIMRRRLGWYVRGGERAEPTEWTLTMRSFSSGLVFFTALIFYWVGLIQSR